MKTFTLTAILLLCGTAFGADPEPYLKSAPMPFYPPIARQARIQGEVRLHFIVDEQGNTKDVIAVGGHSLLQDAAIQDVQNWRFAWAKPCACRVKKEVLFVYSISDTWLAEDGPVALVKWFGKAPVTRVEIQAGGTLAEP